MSKNKGSFSRTPMRPLTPSPPPLSLLPAFADSTRFSWAFPQARPCEQDRHGSLPPGAAILVREIDINQTHKQMQNYKLRSILSEETTERGGWLPARAWWLQRDGEGFRSILTTVRWPAIWIINCPQVKKFLKGRDRRSFGFTVYRAYSTWCGIGLAFAKQMDEGMGRLSCDISFITYF